MLGNVSRLAAVQLALWYLSACGLPASAQESPKRFPIANGAIVAAMQQRRVPVDGLLVKIAAPITASVANPELEIRSFALGNKRSAQLLVACRNSSECLPFYVSVSWPADVDLASLHGSLEPGAASSRDGANRFLSPDENSFRAGSTATLLLDGERVHVMLRVVCLESGEPGERVRVATPDRRQVYVANVIAPGLLKGSF